MQSYLIFGSDNSHPLAWLLNKRHRHVWCIVADLEHQTWVSYDWGQGLPELRTEASLDYDVKAHYEAHGYDVVVIPEGAREAVQGFYILNNCVGHVKSVLGIRGISFVPHQLYKQVTRRKAPPRQGTRGLSLVSQYFYRLVTRVRGMGYRRCRVLARQKARKSRRLNMAAAPGFGGGSGPPPIKWFVDPITRKFAPPDVIDPAQIFGEKDKEAEKARKRQVEQHAAALEKRRAAALLPPDDTNETLLS